MMSKALGSAKAVVIRTQALGSDVLGSDPPPSPASCVVLGKMLNLSEPQFLNYKMRITAESTPESFRR